MKRVGIAAVSMVGIDLHAKHTATRWPTCFALASQSNQNSMTERIANTHLREWIDGVIRELDAIQSPGNPRLTAFSHSPTGLGAQISRRVLALRIAHISGRQAVFPEENMYPYDTCFEPLSETPVQLDSIGPPREPSADLSPAGTGVSVFDFWKFWDNRALREQVYGFLPEGIDRGPQQSLLYEGILLSKMRLKDSYRAHVEAARSRLDLRQDYLGVHVRRGDKKVETPYVPIGEYRQAVCRLAERTGISRVYVASDSPSACEELNLEAYGLTTVFDSDEARYNNANHRFLMQHPEMAVQETYTAIKNIGLLSGARKIVGQNNAHFATLAAAAISFRECSLDPGTLISGSIQLSRSPPVAAFYAARAAARSLAKALLPRLTVRRMRNRGPG